MKTRISQLQRLYLTCDFLRKIIRFSFLVGKLKSYSQSGLTKQLALAANCLQEIEVIRNEVNLNGIEVIDSEVKFIDSISQQINQNAQNLLMQGMETQNQSEVAVALQTFYNLGNYNLSNKYLNDYTDDILIILMIY